MTAPMSCGCPRHAASSSRTARARSGPTAPRRPASGSQCACSGCRTSPTTSTGRPTSSSSSPRAERWSVAKPGARRPPASPVLGARWSALARYLAGPTRPLGRRGLLGGTPLGGAPLGGGLLGRGLLGRTTALGRGPLRRGLLGRTTALGRSPLRRGLLGRTTALGRSPLRRGLLGRTTALGRSPLRRSPPLRGLPGGGAALGGPLGGLSGRRALDCFLCWGPFFGGLSGRSPSLCG